MTAAPPPTADSGAIRIMGLDLQADRKIPRKQVVSWALWDWATQPFNSVILTFVFTALYLTSDSFLSPTVAALAEDDPAKEAGLANLASGLGWAVTIAGVLIALLAPVLGQRADVSGRRKLWLGGATALLILCMFGLFFVQASPGYFVLGVSLIAAGTVFSEIAGVNYNAMLVQVSTRRPSARCRVSAGGVWVTSAASSRSCSSSSRRPSTGGGACDRQRARLPGDRRRLRRVGARLLVAGARVRAGGAARGLPREGAVLPQLRRPRERHRRALEELAPDVLVPPRERGLPRRPRGRVHLRRGPRGGRVPFHFERGARLRHRGQPRRGGVSTILAGLFDDRFGARAVILTALTGLVVAALAVFFLHDSGKLVFWVFGLILCLFVGPAQAASRSFLARVTPAGKESEIFGLYATTGARGELPLPRCSGRPSSCGSARRTGGASSASSSCSQRVSCSCSS